MHQTFLSKVQDAFHRKDLTECDLDLRPVCTDITKHSTPQPAVLEQTVQIMQQNSVPQSTVLDHRWDTSKQFQTVTAGHQWEIPDQFAYIPTAHGWDVSKQFMTSIPAATNRWGDMSKQFSHQWNIDQF